MNGDETLLAVLQLKPLNAERADVILDHCGATDDAE